MGKTSEEKKEYNRKYYQENKKRLLAQQMDYYYSNKETISDKRKQYRQDNKEKVKEDDKRRYQRKREKVLVYKKEYQNTQIGRAYNLVSTYTQADRKYNRGECTITGQWVVDNIFTKTCHYCGETDWHKLGCDRLDNSKPHTPDNVICCCSKCNAKRGTMNYNNFLIRLENERK